MFSYDTIYTAPQFFCFLTSIFVVFCLSLLSLHRQLNRPAAHWVSEEFEIKPIRPVFASEIDLDDDGERPVILTVPVCQGIKDLDCDYFRTESAEPWLLSRNISVLKIR